MEESTELQTNKMHFRSALFKILCTKVTIDFVFSLCMKNVWIGLPLWRIDLDWKVSMPFNGICYKVFCFGLCAL